MHEQVQTLVDSGRLDPEVAEKVSALEPGVYCFHKSWGPGLIKDWDLFGDKMSIDFEDKPGHAMKLEFAAGSLEILDKEHVFAKFVASPEKVRKLALDDPAGFAKLVLASFGGSMLLDRWEDIVKGRIVPDAKYRSWWETTKRMIRTDRRFVLPPKRNVPFELRDESVSPADALGGDFEAAKDPKSKIKVLESIRKDLGAFDEPALELEPIVTACSAAISSALKRSPGAAIELLLARDDLIADVEELEVGGGPLLADVLRDNRKRLPEIVKSLGVGRQRQLYAVMEEAFSDTWVQELIGCLEGSGARAIAEIAKYLNERGKGEQLAEHLLSGLGQRILGAEVLAWICKERKGFAAPVFEQQGVAAALIGALERDQFEEGSSRSNRLHDLLMDDKTLIADLLEGSGSGEVRHFTRRIQATPVFEGLNKNSLLARIVKFFPGVEDLISGEKGAGDIALDEGTQSGLIVSWESLKDRQAKFEELVNKKIPENSKEIGIARDYGDLKENFEFKAAKQQQAVLMRQKAELEAEIAAARGTDFTDADTSHVSVGTIVEFEDLATGQTENVTLLGAWDTDPDKQIVSYLSEMGKILLGGKVGGEFELPTEKEGETRKIRISAIRPYATKAE